MAIGGVAQRPPAVEPPEPGRTSAEDDRPPSPPRGPARAPRWWLPAALLVLATPLVVALVVQHDPRWFPTGDSAQIELRVRDVFSAHPPLIGLGGRIGGSGPAQGSHPGPLAFYVMAPVHRLLGDTAWSFQAATAFVHLTALAVALWLLRRRGGPLLFLGGVAALGLVMAALTAELLTTPWNPYLPLLWLAAFVLAVWSVTCDDLVALPIVAFAGALCAQTHVPYTAVVGAGTVVALAWVVLRLRRPAAAGLSRTRVAWSAVAAGVVAAVVWFPPVFEQLTATSGNLARVVDYFRHPPGDTYGAGDGLRLLFMRLDPWRLLTDRRPEVPFAAGHSMAPFTVVLVVWAVAAVAAWRLRAGVLLRLHGVVAVAVLAAGIAFSRIYGPPFAYLSLWSLDLAALVLLAIGWSAGLVGGRLLPAATARRFGSVAAAVLASAAVALTATATVKGASAEPTEPVASRVLGGITDETVDALRSGDLPGTGPDGTYFMSAADPVYLGAILHGLVNELERAGLRTGSDEALRVAIGTPRVLDPGEATAEVHVAVGPFAAEPRPGSVVVARFDPRDTPLGDRYERLRAEAVRQLEKTAPDLVPRVDEVPQIAGDPRIDARTRGLLNELRDVGAPATVFVGPPPS